MENTFSIALKNRTGLRIVHRPSKRLLQVVQTLLQIVHGVAQYMTARAQRNLRRVLHQVILNAGEGVSHARAFLEVRVLIVVSVVMIAQWAMQAMRAAAIGCHQGLVIFKRVLVIVTAVVADRCRAATATATRTYIVVVAVLMFAMSGAEQFRCIQLLRMLRTGFEGIRRCFVQLPTAAKVDARILTVRVQRKHGGLVCAGCKIIHWLAYIVREHEWQRRGFVLHCCTSIACR